MFDQKNPKVIIVSGKSGSGKTSLISKLIKALVVRNFKISAIKMSHHDIELDQKGKDSFIMRESGAMITILATDKINFTIEKGEKSIEELTKQLEDKVDFVIVETFRKIDNFIRISFDTSDENADLYITDNPENKISKTNSSFNRDEIEKITDWIINTNYAKKNNTGVILNHFNENNEPHMVDISEKQDTKRIAIAEGFANLSKGSLGKIMAKKLPKGDVLSIAQLAGIIGAKKCSELIPLSHNINITSVDLEFEPDTLKDQIKVRSKVSTVGKTGVEMEALTSVSVALLTIYDMVKSFDKRVSITDISLVEKSGGRSGLFRR